jgi:hypothetical protein
MKTQQLDAAVMGKAGRYCSDFSVLPLLTNCCAINKRYCSLWFSFDALIHCKWSLKTLR